MTLNFDCIVVSIEESKNLTEMKVEELQALLEAREIRLEQRNSEREKVAEQKLQASKIHQEVWKIKGKTEKKSCK